VVQGRCENRSQALADFAIFPNEKEKEGFSTRMKFLWAGGAFEFFRIGIAKIRWNWIVPRNIGVKSDLPQNRFR